MAAVRDRLVSGRSLPRPFSIFIIIFFSQLKKILQAVRYFMDNISMFI
jgi:hypothetical protein